MKTNIYVLPNAPICAVKIADQTVNNSIVLVDDTHLQAQVSANKIYKFTFFLKFQQDNAAADWLFHLVAPVGATATWSWGDALTSMFGVYAIGENAEVTNATTDAVVNIIEGILFMGATPGTFKLQWAQKVATAADNKVLTGSNLILQRLN